MRTRAIIGILLAFVVLVFTNPFVMAAMLLICGWHWIIASCIVGAHLSICAVLVSFRVIRKSRLPGLENTLIETAPDWGFMFGDEQQGWLPQWLIDKWPAWVPHWWIAFSCAAWRNVWRNLSFVRALRWLHKPPAKPIDVYEWHSNGVLWKMRTRGWMTEVEYFGKSYFGDFGPRLDQPDAWGTITWAFRPRGKL